jgi:uncharacterized protein YbjT (DUF2867 family)
MSTTVLVVGATGSLGRLVVDEAIDKAGRLAPEALVVIGDVTEPETLPGGWTVSTRSCSLSARMARTPSVRSDQLTRAHLIQIVAPVHS